MNSDNETSPTTQSEESSKSTSPLDTPLLTLLSQDLEKKLPEMTEEELRGVVRKLREARSHHMSLLSAMREETPTDRGKVQSVQAEDILKLYGL